VTEEAQFLQHKQKIGYAPIFSCSYSKNKKNIDQAMIYQKI
jgi:hypothetical protein